MAKPEQTIEGSLDILWENYGDPAATPKYALLFARYKNFKNGAQRPKAIVGDSGLEAYLTKIHFTVHDARERIRKVKERKSVSVKNTIMPAQFLSDYEQ
jgi:hypothetical protein